MTTRPRIGIHRHSLALIEEPERVRMARRGEIVHQAILFLEGASSIRQAVLRAFAFLGEDTAGWKLEADFVLPLEKAFQLAETRRWFAEGPARLREAEIAGVAGEVHRPDLVVVGNGAVEIVDFKVGRREEGHAEQVRSYMELLKAIFAGASVQGFLLYIDEPSVVEIS